MKKTLFVIMAVCLLMATSTSMAAMGEGLKGKMKLGGYAGYTIGMGDAFDDVEDTYLGVTYKYTFEAGLCFGAQFHYGLSPKMMLGGEIGFQSYEGSVETSGSIGGFDFGGIGASGSSTETNILASALYQMSESEKSAFFLTFGGGLYGGGESEMGFFGGIAWEKVMSPKMNLFVMPRVHLVMSDPSMMLIQAVVGLNFGLGNQQ